jgi:hypothetical protein
MRNRIKKNIKDDLSKKIENNNDTLDEKNIDKDNIDKDNIDKDNIDKDNIDKDNIKSFQYKISEYFNKYKIYVEMLQEFYNIINIPEYIINEKDENLKFLHIYYEILKINNILSEVYDSREYEKNKEIINRNKLFLSKYPVLDNNVYNHVCSYFNNFNIQELLILYDKYGYSEFIRLKTNSIDKTIFQQFNNFNLTTRFWTKNMNNIENLAYNISIFKENINSLSGVTPTIIKKTKTIIYENEDNIKNIFDRKIDDQKINNITNKENTGFIESYNKYIENLILNNIKKCNIIPVKATTNIMNMIISSINVYKYMICKSNYELINLVIEDINKTIIGILFKLNDNIKNKKELYYGNTKIVMELSKKIEHLIKIELNNSKIKLPITDKTDKYDLSNKLKDVLIKSITYSGIISNIKSLDQTLCL